MDQKAIFDLIADNSVVGAAGSVALVLLYKIWRILQTDKREDNLDAAEKEFREEMRKDIKELREQLKKCEEEKDKIYARISNYNLMLSRVQSVIHHCNLSHPDGCPISQVEGIFDEH